MSMKNIIPKNENDTNSLPINMIAEQSSITFHKLPKDNSKIKLLETVSIPYTVDSDEYEKMNTSDNDHGNEYKYYFENLDVALEDENYKYVEKLGIILDDLNNTTNSEQQDYFLDDDISVEKHLGETSILPDCENEDNLEEPNIILADKKDYNKLKQPDVILKSDIGEHLEESDVLLDCDVSVKINSDKTSILPDVEIEDNLKESDVILESEYYECVEEPEIELINSNDTNSSEQQDDLQEDVSVEYHSDQHSVIPDGKNEKNVKESDDLLDDDPNVQNHLDQLNEDSLKETDVIFECENYKYVEKPDSILDDSNDTNNSEQLDELLGDDTSVENHLDETSILLDCKNEDNLEEPDVIHEGEDYKYDVEEPDIILDDSNDTKNSDKLNVISEETYASEQNTIKLFETLKNEKKPDNYVMVDRDNVMYPIKPQSNALENLTSCIYGLTKENRSHFDNQIIEKENENYVCNIIDGNQTSVVIREDEIAEVVENTDNDNKPSTSINFQIIENHKECNNQNENYLYDEYQLSNNYVLSELSSVECNPIPEFGFNHLTMTGNESNQLEIYEALNQPTSVLLNESFLNNISLGTTADIIENRDSVVNNNEQIVIDEKSEDFEPSSNTTIITNLYNKVIKSYQLVESTDIASQLVESKDITSQQVDTYILNSAKRGEFAIDVQNSCSFAAPEPGKTLIFEEFPQNSMLFKDNLTQEETSKLVHFIKCNSDNENSKNSEKNEHNLSTDKKKDKPFIDQKVKNIPNLRKRRYGTKCFPYSDTKLTTKSRCESKTKQVELKIISSNISSPTSDIFKDCLVSMSKKRLKCQKKVALIKRRRVCPKYVASNSKIDLEQISGESTTNKDKNFKKIGELLPNNLPIKIEPEAENYNKILKQNIISRTKNLKHTFFLEPKIILEKFDVSLYKNRFKLLSMANNDKVSLSTNKTNSQKPTALKRLKNGCLKSMKEPTGTNTVIDLDELNEDSINNDKNKAVTKKSKLNSSYKIKKVELDKNLKSSSDRCVVTSLIPDPINCVNKIQNSLIEETINLISDNEFVSDEVQEEMVKISPDKEKLNWRIISHEAETNMDAIPKIRIGRNKSEINTLCVGSQLDFDAINRCTKIVLEQELGLKKKSSESKIQKFNQQVCRRSARKILKRQKCSCCTNKLMDAVCSSNVL